MSVGGNFMETIIAPAVIASIVSIIGVLGKEIWFDRKNRKRQTKILAWRLYYILNRYAFDCAKQLQSTSDYVYNQNSAEYTSELGEYNVSVQSIPIQLQDTDWIEMDEEIISALFELEIGIQLARERIEAAGVMGDIADEYELEANEYIKEASKIGKSSLNILSSLTDKYKIPHIEILLGNTPIEDFFEKNIHH